jgi:hypothetical protein
MPTAIDRGQVFTVNKVQTMSGYPLEVTTVSGQATYIQPATTAGDSFGRLRIAEPFTLFDSSHRYRDNELWNTSTGAGGTYAFNSDQGLVDLNVTTASGAKVIRETKRVFPYQPGKSLQVMNTFVMDSGVANRRQRVGYFSSGNGFYIEVSGTAEPYIVSRTSVSGSIVDTRIPQSEWNIDKLNGSGDSGFTLDPTKAQLSWFDFEWLGVGTVRAGFIIDGEFILCHSFHHANIIDSTYMTTATLPCRYEIENLGTTTVTGQLKQSCSTVISEGGYELRGQGRSVATPVGSPYDLTATGTEYPVASIRLKSTKPDAVAILAGIALLGTTNNANYQWKLVAGATSSGGTWTTTSADSSVEYNITATGVDTTNAISIVQGYAIGSNQGSTPITLDKDSLFKYQLERNSFDATFTELTLCLSTDTAGADVLAALDWEEVTA